MADKVLCEKNDLVAVANAIRSKNGTTNTYKVNQLASAVSNLQSSPNLQSKELTITSNGTTIITADSGYDGLENVKVGVDVTGSSGGGFSVTFPSTATNWNKQTNSVLLKADGTSLDITNYSVIAGKTISNVFAITSFIVESYYFLSMNISEGIVSFIHPSLLNKKFIAPCKTTTMYGSSQHFIFYFAADTIITSIKFEYTD